MKVTVVIPARIDSSRLPRKALIDIAGKPMLWHVYVRALEADVGDVFVATDSPEIESAMLDLGAKVVRTGPASSGTHRVFLASKMLPGDVFLNLQGDEPLMVPESLRILVRGFLRDDAPMGTLAVRKDDPSEMMDPNVVKVVTDGSGNALYFSRSPIPFSSKSFMKHIGVYIYRKGFLEVFNSLGESPLERIERLEQLRALWYGYTIKVYETPHDSIGVDTPEDLEKVRGILERFQDPQKG